MNEKELKSNIKLGKMLLILNFISIILITISFGLFFVNSNSFPLFLLIVFIYLLFYYIISQFYIIETKAELQIICDVNIE